MKIFVQALIITCISASTILLPSSSNPKIKTFRPPGQFNTSNCYILMPGGACDQCLFGYFLKNQECIKGKQNCKTYNPLNGNCSSCYIGYKLDKDGSCLRHQRSYIQQGCSYLIVKSCLSCSLGYYFNYDGYCELIDTLCQLFDFQNKRCITCYKGYAYKLNYGKCVYSNSEKDSNCVLWQDNQCLDCNNGYYLGDNGICTQSNPNCKVVNSKTNECMTCYEGYISFGVFCILNPQTYKNYLCSAYDLNGTCISCYYRSVLNSFGHCVQVNPLCQTFNPNGYCLTCYNGYQLRNQTCISSAQLSQDPNCAVWQERESKCLVCVPWSYFDPSKRCQLVSSLCRTFDSNNGECTSCYVGFQLSNGSCTISKVDNYCQVVVNNTCLSCFGGYYYNSISAKCEVANNLCQTIDSTNNCRSCYLGYTLISGKCVILDAYCDIYNSDGTCNSCLKSYFLNQNRLCISKNQNCVNYNIQTSRCLDCQQEYYNNNGSCYPTVQSKTNYTGNKSPSDPQCAQWTSNESVCLACSAHSFYNSQGICQRVSDFCLTFSKLNGQCLTCFTGYELSDRTCIIITNNCRQSDSQGRCLSCYLSYYLQNEKCLEVNPLCQQFNYTSLECIGCYGGYSLVNKSCIIST